MFIYSLGYYWRGAPPRRECLLGHPSSKLLLVSLKGLECRPRSIEKHVSRALYSLSGNDQSSHSNNCMSIIFFAMLSCSSLCFVFLVVYMNELR